MQTANSTTTSKTTTLLATLLLLTTSPAALAYKPDVAHHPLLTTALEIYNQCFSSHDTYQSEARRGWVLLGNTSMDNGLPLEHYGRRRNESALHLITRLRNWHFYNRDRRYLSRAFLIEQSHKNLWKSLNRGFERNRKTDDKLLFLGGIMHLLEDVSVPAHTIPIYHGPAMVERFGPRRMKPLVDYMRKAGKIRGGMVPDSIDDMPPNLTALKKSLKPTAEFCENIATNRDSPKQIRSRLSRQTLAAIQESIPDCGDIRWASFWLMPKPKQYFGRYNIANNRPLFNEAGTMVDDQNASCTFEKEDKRYAGFVHERHKQAIIADLHLLSWAHRQIEAVR